MKSARRDCAAGDSGIIAVGSRGTGNGRVCLGETRVSSGNRQIAPRRRDNNAGSRVGSDVPNPGRASGYRRRRGFDCAEGDCAVRNTGIGAVRCCGTRNRGVGSNESRAVGGLGQVAPR